MSEQPEKLSRYLDFHETKKANCQKGESLDILKQ